MKTLQFESHELMSITELENTHTAVQDLLNAGPVYGHIYPNLATQSKLPITPEMADFRIIKIQQSEEWGTFTLDVEPINHEAFIGVTDETHFPWCVWWQEAGFLGLGNNPTSKLISINLIAYQE